MKIKRVRGFIAIFVIALLILAVIFGYHKICWFLIANGKEPDHFLIPVEGKTKLDIRDEFEVISANGKKHHGTDIFAPKGTQIRAAADSIIVKVKPEEKGSIGGNLIYALGGGRILYLYSHLSRFQTGIKRGRQIKAGDIIGYVGDTGNARGTSPHLHFGMYKINLNPFRFFSKAINPYFYLQK